MLVTSCTWVRTDVQRGYEEQGGLQGARIYTTADIRVVSQRQHPVTHQWVTCTEPTPDVAKALSTAAQVSLKGGNKAANGEVGLSGGSAEAIAELAGRSTALLALRDGLFRACEAHENGAIGADAYSLVLGRYGQLMTTLFLGEDIQGAARAAASVKSPDVSTPNGGGKSGGSSDATASGGSQPADSQKAPTNVHSSLEIYSNPDPAGFLHVAAAATAPPAKDSKTQAQAAQIGSANVAGSSSTAGDTNDSKPGAMSNAGAVVQLNKDFLDLDKSHLVHLLVVACINEYDPTRDRSVTGPAGNPFLQGLCPSLKDLQSIVSAQKNVDLVIQSTAVTDPPAK